MKKNVSMFLSVVMSSVLLFTGCAGTPATTTTASGPGNTTTAAGSGNTTTAVAQGKIKVALILSGPANDQGWNATALEGLKKAETDFGITTAYMENVSIADSESAFRDFATQGFDLVIGHGFQYGEPAAKIGKDFPGQYFMATESNSSGDNMASFVMSCEEGAYLMGMLSDGMTKSNVIGVVGGFEQPSIIKELEAFKLGAKEINPGVKVLEIYVNSFVDASLGKEAALSMIDQGADVLYHVANQAGTGVITAAKEKGLLALGNSYDQNSIAPDAIITSTVYKMPLVITQAVQQVIDKKFKGGVFYLGMSDSVVDVAPFHGFESKVPKDLMDKVLAKKEAITKNEFKVPRIESPTK